jgi:hypothetical protein
MIRNADNSVTLTEKEYNRLIRLACGEYGKTEQEMLNWLNDDEDLCWEPDAWYSGFKDDEV